MNNSGFARWWNLLTGVKNIYGGAPAAPKPQTKGDIRQCKKCGRPFYLTTEHEDYIHKTRMQYPQKCEKCRKG